MSRRIPVPRLRSEAIAEPLSERLSRPLVPLPAGEIVLYWLGQAGFVIDFDCQRILIDPYLSDSLARKYRDARYRHVRMMASPISPEQFTRLDLVLCTHQHTDHMDPDTLRPLAAAFADMRFVVPAASLAEAAHRCGVSGGRLIAADAGAVLEPLPGLRIRPLAAAHESVDLDAEGHSKWLGYGIEVNGVRLYHSGDCVPYPGLAASVSALAPQLALLPVNGRDTERSRNGVPGNFTLDEAIVLCREAGVPAMVAHHYGMFEFNTVSAAGIEARVPVEAQRDLTLIRARLGTALHIESSD